MRPSCGVPTRSSKLGRAILAAILALGCVAVRARAEGGFSLHGERWDGLSRFVALADEESVPIELATSLDAGTLDAREAVILLDVEPGRAVSRLAAFVERGGALVVADESESITPLLTRLGFRRFDDAGEEASLVPGREGLYVAAPTLEHPIVEGVDWLVLNLPRPFFHEGLVPIVALDAERHLVAIGRLGEGELIALGDSSLFIDQMLGLRGNERFARNLLRLLAERGRVRVVVGPGRIFGVPPGAKSRGGIGEVRDALSRVASIPTSPLALYLGSVIALGALVIYLASKLLGAEAFQGPRDLVLPGREGGVAGTVAFHRAHSSDLRRPTLVYRRTLYEALSTMLDAELKTPDQVAARLAACRLSRTLAEDAHALLSMLDDIHAARGKEEVSPRTFRRLVQRGERLLGAVEAAS